MTAAPPRLRHVLRLAEGGMGYVELAVREGVPGGPCAVKRPHPEHRRDPRFRAMFLDEARLASRVQDPNVVRVLDVGEDAEGPYLIMELVEGLPLGRIIKETAPPDEHLPLAFCIDVIAQAARGLHAAHTLRGEDGQPLGLVHRDVSPQNILVGFDGIVRVTDFGIARALGNQTVTTAGLLKGNLGYMAPEQLRFERPDARSDLFSLGVVLYEALSRERLYGGGEREETARRILTEPPPDPGELRTDIPPELAELLFELLSKARDERPSDARAVAERLEAIGRALTGGEPFDSTAWLEQRFGALRADLARRIAEATSARPRRARRWPIAAAAAVALAGAVTWGVLRARPPERTVAIGALAVPFAVDAYFDASGYMGDGADPASITMTPSPAAPDRACGGKRAHPRARGDCHRIVYTPGAKRWGGVLWQFPANNWGQEPGRLIAPGATRVTFYARGERGGEVVRFLVGSAANPAEARKGASQAGRTVTLTTDWTRHTVSLAQVRHGRVGAGFGWTVRAADNGGAPVAFAIDDIAWE